MALGGQPALTCAECGRSMPLADAVKLDPVRRQLTCRGCGTVASWDIDDTRPADVPESHAHDAQDDVESPGPPRRREGQ